MTPLLISNLYSKWKLWLIKTLKSIKDSKRWISNEPLFDDKFMMALLPQHFKISKLENYDETTDPDNHLVSFRATMLFHENLKPIIY